MFRNLLILFVAGVVIIAPFLFQQEQKASAWREGDPMLYIISPHNEAIRYEFERAFSLSEIEAGRKPVRIEWINIGGTTEILRYLKSAYGTSFKASWQSQGKPWPDNGVNVVTDARFNTKEPGKDVSAQKFDLQLQAYTALRATDDPKAFGIRRDLFFGGGEFDHSKAFGEGYTVRVWPEGQEPKHLFTAPDGTLLIPERLSGELWRTPAVLGNCVSAFGIVYNADRLTQLGFPIKASTEWQWDDLADPRLFRQVGVADPTKSGSIAKAFEMIIHQKVYQRVRREGFDDAQIASFEKLYGRDGKRPTTVPEAYQRAVEAGWVDGLRLVQLIGANARYFTDAAGKVPIDVGQGDAAAGMCIDFYGRFQAQVSIGKDGQSHMEYVTPRGGSSVSCDPISLLRGSPNRELAVRFIEFVLSVEGQKLWTYKPGTPGGPEKFALRRIPIRRDFYPSTQPSMQASHEQHLQYAADDLADPTIDPYALAETFTYQRRWTGSHFGIQRDLIRAMCMDSGEELRGAWSAIIRAGGPDQQPDAMNVLNTLPVIQVRNKETGVMEDVKIEWSTITSVSKKYDTLDYMREWTEAFRGQYRRAGSSVKVQN